MVVVRSCLVPHITMRGMVMAHHCGHHVLILLSSLVMMVMIGENDRGRDKVMSSSS